MGGDIYIRQTKRSTYRPMNTMNGDFLSKLKKPMASELSRELKGQNAAHNEVMKKQLDLWYRERNIMLEKMNRGQEEVYTTLLNVHKEKKRLVREAWKKQQEESRMRAEMDRDFYAHADILNSAASPESGTGKTETFPNTDVAVKRKSTTANNPQNKLTIERSLDKNPEDIVTEEHEGKHIPVSGGILGPADESQVTVMENGSINPTVKRTKPTGKRRKSLPPSSSIKDKLPPVQTRTPKGQTTKVLEVQKHNPLQPLVRERSSNDLVDTTRTPSFVRDLPDKLECFSSLNVLVADEAMTENVPPERAEKVSPQKEVTRKRKGSRTMAKSPTRLSLPPISEHVISEDVSKGPGSDKGISSEKKPKSLEDGTITKFLPSVARAQTELDQPVNQIERNKRNARRKEKRRRQLLDKEDFTLYVKNRRGDIVPSDCPFSRKEFKPPSMREKLFQQKMLKAQTEAIDNQMQKMEVFMEKIDAEERAKRRLRDRQRQQEEEERRLKEAKPREQLGVTLQQLVAAFVTPDSLPKGMDPNSFEAMHHCKYVREYDSMQTQQRKLAREEKHSSWNNSLFSK